jgi:hypothetical protein
LRCGGRDLRWDGRQLLCDGRQRALPFSVEDATPPSVYRNRNVPLLLQLIQEGPGVLNLHPVGIEEPAYAIMCESRLSRFF